MQNGPRTARGQSLIERRGGTFELKSKLRFSTGVIATSASECVMSALAPVAEIAPPLPPENANLPRPARRAGRATSRSSAQLSPALHAGAKIRCSGMKQETPCIAVGMMDSDGSGARVRHRRAAGGSKS